MIGNKRQSTATRWETSLPVQRPGTSGGKFVAAESEFGVENSMILYKVSKKLLLRNLVKSSIGYGMGNRVPMWLSKMSESVE